MLRLSTRLFAAGTLAATLISFNQGGFAHEAKPKIAKSAKAVAPCCAMCAKKEVKTATKTSTLTPKGAKLAPTKTAKLAVKTTVAAKIAPKAATKPIAAKAGAKGVDAAPMTCCVDEDASM